MNQTGHTGAPLISVIVPVFNEADGIEQLRTSLADLRIALGGELEFIFVDDGSRDDTVSRLRVAFGNDRSCRIAVHQQNRGIGAAFRTGFSLAHGEIVCTIDADCSYRPQGLKQLVDALQTSQAGVAVASPYHPLGGVEGVPTWRLMLSRGCSILYRLVAPVRLYTYTSVFRAYRREVLERISFQQNGFASAVEILYSAARLGYEVVEVPMILRGRAIGQSKMKIARTIRTHLQLMGEQMHVRPSNVDENATPSITRIPNTLAATTKE